jgi:hypothetical protein
MHGMTYGPDATGQPGVSLGLSGSRCAIRMVVDMTRRAPLRWRPSRDVLAGIGGAAQVAVVLLTAPAARRWYNRWGATPAEVAGTMPGDELVPVPKMASTGAITISAASAEAPCVLVLAGADPKTRTVQHVPADRDELATTWQWTLQPDRGGLSTRLVARQRFSYPPGQSLLWHLVEPTGFVMERRMLAGIKARAEARVRRAA